jgi:3D (Asp-Asp-Asp) domain-containing protein
MVGLIFIIALAPTQDTVTATTYKLTAKENGPYGNRMASGFRVNEKLPGNDKVVAVSRDMLEKYPFHSYIKIEGTGKLDGIWRIEDIMNRRYRKRIDLLINWKVKHNKFSNVKITKYEYKSNLKSSKRRPSSVHRVRTKRVHKQIQDRKTSIKRHPVHR